MGLFDGFSEIFTGPKPSGSLADLEAKNGFRDLKFGCNVSSVAGLAPVAELNDAGDVLYSRPGDSLRIGEADLTEITYEFYRTELSAVHLTVSSYQEFNRLCEVFLKAYGIPEFERGVDDYFWKSQSVSLFVSWNPAGETGFALMSSVPIRIRAAADREADAARGVADL